jgi:plastocyanin
MRSRFSRRSNSSTLAASLLGLALAATVGSSGATQAKELTVTIDGLKFEPAAVTVSRGDTVVWINKDPFPHTVTARGAFDSREIAAGKSWKLTARKTGTFQYVCTLHPTMKGALTVE